MRATENLETRVAQIDKNTRERLANELIDAKLPVSGAALADPRIVRLLKECRSIRRRIMKDSDQMISKARRKTLDNFKDQLKIRRQKLKDLVKTLPKPLKKSAKKDKPLVAGATKD